MSQSKRDDRLDALLDSLSGDAELERKMDAFSSTREEDEEKTGPILTVKDNRESDYDVPSFVQDEGDTIVTGKPPADQPEEGGSTMVFAPDEIEDTADNPGSTVVLDNSEIDNLIEEEKGPSLRRERVSRPGSGPKKDRRKTDWKAAGIIAAVIAVIALGGLLIFGISHMMSNVNSDKTEEKDTQADFDALKKWAQELTGTADTGIKDFETRWNRLSDKQKREINEILRKNTGKSFDEILAEEKAGQKADKDNNNTEVAEQKARLKDQIAQLQSQLSAAQSDYDAAQGKINDAQSRVDNASGALADAQSTYSSAQQNVYDLQSQIDSLNSQIQELQNTPSEGKEPDEMAQIQKQLSELISQQSSLKSQLSSAQSSLDQAAGVVQARQNDLASAQGALDALSGSTDSAQKRIDDLNSQISSLQSQLDALK